MPIYEYRCGACGYQKEFLQRLSDAPLTDCPECGKRAFNKLVTAAGFHLKGTGWYATDFKNSGEARGQAGQVPIETGQVGYKAGQARNKAGQARNKAGQASRKSRQGSAQGRICNRRRRDSGQLAYGAGAWH